MRIGSSLACMLCLAVFAGCSNDDIEVYDGPMADSFVGRLVQNGKPVSFPAGKQVELQIFHHETGMSSGVPIKPDGSFNIGRIEAGKYSATLKQEGPAQKGGKGGPGQTTYTVPGGFEIVEGKADYEIELGEGFKPETAI